MIHFVDFEASSIQSGSFPIEIAWVSTDGHGESYLIRPSQRWIDGGGWRYESEQMHGIGESRHVLSPQDVTAFSDAPAFDNYWLRQLLGAGGETRSVTLLNVHQAYASACRCLLADVSGMNEAERAEADWKARCVVQGIIARAEEAEARRPRIHHRALSDAESLWRIWQAVRKEVSEMPQPDQSPAARRTDQR